MVSPSDSTSITPEPRKVRPDEAHAASRAGRAVLLDVRDARLFDNARLNPSVSLPLARIEAAGGRLPASVSVPEDGLLILYCA